MFKSYKVKMFKEKRVIKVNIFLGSVLAFSLCSIALGHTKSIVPKRLS